MNLHGKVVLVTGASRGIGEATARAAAARGAKVALVARGAERLEEVAASIGASAGTDVGAGAIAIAADVADPAECARVVAETTDRLGPVDVLIANAGVLRRDFIEDIDPADFEASWRTNVGAAVWLAQAVMGGMRERGDGRIVLVSSELGLIGAPSYASYCTTKFALIGLAEVLAHELHGTGVGVTAVCPGNVRTDQLAEEYAWGLGAGAPPEQALAPESVARTILRALDGHALVVLADKPGLRLQFDTLMSLPRRARLPLVRDAYKALLADRRRRLSAGGRIGQASDGLVETAQDARG